MDIIKVRHFIICEDIELGDKNMFTPKNVYEFFSAPEYPSHISFNCIIGIYFFQPGTDYHLKVTVHQGDKLLGGWTLNEPVTVDKPDEIMNFPLAAKRMKMITDGPVRFQIEVNGQVIDEQFVMAVKE